MYILKQKPQNNKDDGWFIADGEGDPPRTLLKKYAKSYKTIAGAKRAITYYKNRYGHIRKIDLEIIKKENT